MRFRMAVAIAAAVIPVAIAAAPISAGASTPTPTKPAPTKPAPTKPAPTKPAPTKPAYQKPAQVKAVSSVTLTEADNGRAVRVHMGEQILVRLAVNPRRDPDPTTWWRAVDESGSALQARPQTALAIRGLTRGRYRAVAGGEATLSSSRAVCPPTGPGPACHAMRGWSVTVDVR